MLPFVGTHPAEIVHAREVLIHGDRYFDCDILLAQDAGAPARQTIRVAAHAAKVRLEAGVKVRIRFILGQADEVTAG